MIRARMDMKKGSQNCKGLCSLATFVVNVQVVVNVSSVSSTPLFDCGVGPGPTIVYAILSKLHENQKHHEFDKFDK